MTLFDLWYELFNTYIFTSSISINFGNIPVLFSAIMTMVTVMLPVYFIVRIVFPRSKK